MKGTFYSKRMTVYGLALAVIIFSVQVVSSWSDPSTGPTANNVDYPLLTSDFLATQTKSGSLTFYGLEVDQLTTLANSVKITGGSPGAGKVLVSDDQGLARWATLVPAEEEEVCRGDMSADTKSWKMNGRTFYYNYTLRVNPNNNAEIVYYSNVDQLDESGVWTDPSVFVSKNVPRKITVSPNACVYTYSNAGTGRDNPGYCLGLDQRVNFMKIGTGGGNACVAKGVNGTDGYEGEDNNGNAGCYTLCKEVDFEYVPKTPAQCTSLATETNGEYKGISKTATDPALTSGTVYTCDTTYTKPPEYSCPADNNIYTMEYDSTLNKCKRTIRSSGAVAYVNPNVKKYTPKAQCAPGWTPYRSTCI